MIDLGRYSRTKPTAEGETDKQPKTIRVGFGEHFKDPA